MRHSSIYDAAFVGHTELARMLALRKASTQNHTDVFKVLAYAIATHENPSDTDSDDEEQDTTESLPSSSMSTSFKS